MSKKIKIVLSRILYDSLLFAILRIGGCSQVLILNYCDQFTLLPEVDLFPQLLSFSLSY